MGPGVSEIWVPCNMRFAMCFIYIYIIYIYNMIGVAVAMVISTMHEKSCIDSHNARKFE